MGTRDNGGFADLCESDISKDKSIVQSPTVCRVE